MNLPHSVVLTLWFLVHLDLDFHWSPGAESILFLVHTL